MLAGLSALGIGATVAWAFTVTQSSSTSGTPPVTTFTYTVTVGTNERLQDFHLKVHPKDPKKPDGRKIKQNTVNAPSVGGTSRTGWTHTASATSEANSGADTVHWETQDNTTGSDSDATDDPGAPGETVTFSFTTFTKHGDASLDFWCTSDGKTTPPTTDPGGQVPGPVAEVTPHETNNQPARGSAQAVALTSTEDGMPWHVYLAASLPTDDPATDPLGIGLNTNDPIPPAFGITVDQQDGTWGAPPAPDLATASINLSVGTNAPAGYHFYLVLVGTRDGAPYLWSDSIEFVVQ